MSKRSMLVVTTTTMVMVSSILFGMVASSVALASPKGIFSIFSDCPVNVPGVALCQFGQITSGEFAIGSTRVQIDETITLQDGAIPTGNPENLKEYFVIPAADGSSLSETELNVPGGLLGAAYCDRIKGESRAAKNKRRACRAFAESGPLRVTAVAESVAGPRNPAILDFVALASGEGAGLTLPVRIHLKNLSLGTGCYIGSEANPIELHLTTGTTAPLPPNQPITGFGGERSNAEENGQLALQIAGFSLVDNTFSVPAAEGCGGSSAASFIDPLVNRRFGLPSASGHNTAIFNGTMNLSTAEAVIESEKFASPSPAAQRSYRH